MLEVFSITDNTRQPSNSYHTLTHSTDGTGLEVLCFVVVRLSICTFSRK